MVEQIFERFKEIFRHGTTTTPKLQGLASFPFIPVERINGPILCIASTDDEDWPSVEFARMILARRQYFRSAFATDLCELQGLLVSKKTRWKKTNTYVTACVYYRSRTPHRAHLHAMCIGNISRLVQNNHRHGRHS